MTNREWFAMAGGIVIGLCLGLAVAINEATHSQWRCKYEDMVVVMGGSCVPADNL